MKLPALLCALLLLAPSGAGAEPRPPRARTYHDGDQALTVYLDDRWLARLGPAGEGLRSRSVTLVPVGNPRHRQALRRGRVPADLPANHVPVFTTTPDGGRRLALPGGVLVYVAGMGPAEAGPWLARQGLKVLGPVSFERAGFLVAAPPGLPSLDLAESLRRRPGIARATPLWWREAAPR